MRRHRTWLHRTVWIAGGSLALAGAGGCSDDAERVTEETVIQPGRPGEEATTLPPGSELPPSEDPFSQEDVDFLVQMIPHHRQAMEMSELAPDRASNPKVLGLASRIYDVQKIEIGGYERWLAEHGYEPDGSATSGADDHGGHGMADHDSMPGMASARDLADLKALSGNDFDKRWLELMIAHHEGALTMATQRETGGTNTRVGEFAADVVVTQTDEIQTMRAILDEI